MGLLVLWNGNRLDAKRNLRNTHLEFDKWMVRLLLAGLEL